MIMKNSLAKVIAAGLVCANAFAGSACADSNWVTLDIDDDVASLNFVGDYYGGTTDGSVIKISGNNDKNIILKGESEDRDYIGCWLYPSYNDIGILHQSNGITTISSDKMLSIDAMSTAKNFKAISNQAGKLIFNNDVESDCVIENKKGAVLEFKSSLDLFPYVMNETGNSSIGIINEGTLNIKENGYLTAHRKFMAEVTDESYYDDYTSEYMIDNRGNLEINANLIEGNIKHSEGAETIINMYYTDSGNNSHGNFYGNIIGSDEKFSLTLNENTGWFPRHQIGEVEGIIINNGYIFLSVDNYMQKSNNNFDGFLPAYSWNNDFDTLTLKNIKGTGGQVDLSTDLVNNIGDQLIFTGSVPDNFNLGVFIFNKDDNNGVPIKREDGHSVTIISAPSDAKLNVGASLGFYGKNDLSLYNPIIDEIIEGNVKNWNFVGWAEGGHKTVGEEIKQLPVEPWINHIELDNTLKRINDIRTDPSEVGAWLRGENGKMKIRSYGYKYNLMSGGYDWKYESDAAKMFLGFGISYAKNNCDTGIIGDTKSMGYNLYGSWLGRENNDYVDVIVKYGTLDKKYAGLDDNNVFVTGDYDKKLFSVAAKYGRRITRDDGWYYEPSVGLTWGRIGSADFIDSQGINIHADSSTTKMATLGMQVGKNIQGTEFYGLFQVRHDFDGKMHVSVPGSDLPGSSVYDDMGGTWYKVGIGAARKINKNNSFYMDIEKDFGNKVKKPYAIGAGYRYTF